MADIGITKFRVQIPRGGATPSTPGFAQSEGQDPVNPPGSPTGIYVPYLGATGGVNLGEFGLSTGYVTFDTTPTGTPTTQGTTYWDDSKSTVALIMNGTTQHIGQDQFVYVKNSTGSPIAKGVAVRNSGTDGGSGHILIEPMLANGTNASETFIGVTAEAIANGSFGQVMAFGELAGINTSTYTAGAFLYVSTTVAGQFQTTAPVAPNNIILVGRAINSKNNGDIFVRPTIGSNINNDEGVKITSPATGDLLQRQSNGLWENRTVAQVIGTAYVPSTRTLTINGTAFDLSANRSWSVGTVTSVGVSVPTGLTVSNTPITSTGTIAISLQTGYSIPTTAKQTEWDLAYTNRITSLTTTGSSGAATLISNVLNIPNYTLAGLGGVPTTRTLTINGTAFDLSTNRSWTVGTIGGSIASGQVAFGSGTNTVSGSNNLYWDSATNRLSIGRGAETPSNQLQIIFTQNAQGGVETTLAAFGNKNSWSTNDASMVRVGFSDLASVYNGTDWDFYVKTGSSGAPTEKFRIKGNGNVLIGTTTDNGAKVQVNGGATLVGNVILDSGANRIIGLGTGTSNPRITFGSAGSIVVNVASGNNVNFERAGGNFVTFTGAGIRTYAGGIQTTDPYLGTADVWELGTAATTGTSTPDRWIRVQIGGEYYDILAVHRGTVPT